MMVVMSATDMMQIAIHKDINDDDDDDDVADDDGDGYNENENDCLDAKVSPATSPLSSHCCCVFSDSFILNPTLGSSRQKNPDPQPLSSGKPRPQRQSSAPGDRLCRIPGDEVRNHLSGLGFQVYLFSKEPDCTKGLGRLRVWRRVRAWGLGCLRG